MLEKRLKLAFAEFLAIQTVIGKNLYPQEPELLGEYQTFSRNQGAKFELYRNLGFIRYHYGNSKGMVFSIIRPFKIPLILPYGFGDTF